MLKVGVHSDLHTEFSVCTITNLPELDVLVLAGDMGDLSSMAHFLGLIRRKAPGLPVLYVLGNHEYDTVKEYKKARAFLHEALRSENKTVRKKVVISHFLPAFELLATAYRQNTDALIQSAYWATDIPQPHQLADDWIYGHSHDCIETTVGTTRFLSNQRGYSKVMNGAQSADYQHDYCVEI